MLISVTFDFERALGGPQVQLSQAERHLTEECNLSLQRGTSMRKNKLGDGKKRKGGPPQMPIFLGWHNRLTYRGVKVKQSMHVGKHGQLQ